MKEIRVILNESSGSNGSGDIKELIKGHFADHGYSALFTELGSGGFSECEKLIKESEMVVAAGGDGTVNAVAELCYKHKVKLGVIPLGTFNYFARELKIPLKVGDAVTIIAENVSRKVAVGTVKDKIFLNNASFGLYSKIIKNRERDKALFGRFRIVAIISAISCLLRGQKPLSVKIKIGDVEDEHLTPMVFVGNNTLQLNNLGMDIAECTAKDMLGVAVMKKSSRLVMAWLLFLGMIKNLEKENTLETFCTEEFEVDSKRHAMDVVIDGEIIRCKTPLKFAVVKNALEVIVPMTTEE